MVGGGSLGPRRGRLRANVSGSASILGLRLRLLSLVHLPWPNGASGRPSWAIALTCGKLLYIHVRMTHATSRHRTRRRTRRTSTQPILCILHSTLQLAGHVPTAGKCCLFIYLLSISVVSTQANSRNTPHYRCAHYTPRPSCAFHAPLSGAELASRFLASALMVPLGLNASFASITSSAWHLYVNAHAAEPAFAAAALHAIPRSHDL